MDTFKSVKQKSRLDKLNKLAATYSRKDVEYELKKIRNTYNKAMQNYERANTELAAKQQEVDNWQAEMNASRQKLLDLNQQIQTMDLSGADGVYSVKDETFYVVDGKKYHIDISDISDVKKIPYREYRAQSGKPEEDSETEEINDVSLVDDIFKNMDLQRFE